MGAFRCALALLCALFCGCEAIKCYNCISTINSKCVEPRAHADFEPQECIPELLKDLSDNAKMIAQEYEKLFRIDYFEKSNKDIGPNAVCQKVESVVNEQRVVMRGCQLSVLQDTNHCDQMMSKLPKSSSITHCSLCGSDGCNAGHGLAAPPPLLLLVPALLVPALLVPAMLAARRAPHRA